MSKMDDLNVFNVSIEDLTKDDKPQGNANLYSPSYDKAKDGVYKSKIRFLPNVFNPRETMMRKYVYFLKDLNTDQGFYVDSPSTINEKCIIQDTFFKLRNSNSAADKELSENLKRKEFWYSAVQIIQDKQFPELEGKVMIFRYGFKIKQKIDEQLKPVVEDDEPNNPFDLFDGKVFNLVICKKDGFANYDSSKFASSGSAIVIDGNEMSDDDDDRETIVEYLKENTPDFNEFKFKPWDEDMKKKVLKTLCQYGSAGADIKKLMKQNDEEEEEEAPKPKKKKVVEDDEEEEAPKSKKPRIIEEDEDEEPAPKKKKKVVEDDDEDEEPKPKKKKQVVEEDDEEEEPKPKKKKKVEEDEDEDEEPAPKKNKKKSSDDDDDDDFDEFLKDIDNL